MDSGNSGTLQSLSTGDGGGVLNLSSHFNSIPNLQQPSNFFHASSFNQPPNPNPNPSSFYNHNLDSNPVDDSGNEKLGVTTKNPKKRTRASRRAPTTVLTTDTTNFRQMVQEFTGIPPAPFSGSSSSSSPFARRIDLFTGGIGLNPFLNSGTGTASNFHIPPSGTQGFTKQALNLSNLQNRMFPLPSVPQTTLSQQVDAIEGGNEGLEVENAVLKRWRGEDENLVNFEGVNGTNGNVVVLSRGEGDGDQDQLPGNEDSWSF